MSRLFLTFAITDWVMSLDAHWYSTIYGVLFMIGQVLSAGALTALIIGISAKTDAYKKVVTPALTKDLGNLMLTFTMLWAYMSLSQFLIIWSGNLPEEASYFVTRNTGPLLLIGTLVVCGQFFFPFVCLLSGKTKRRPHYLAAIAAWILLMRVLDVFWVVKPMFLDPMQGDTTQLPLHWMDFAAFLGLGGLWLAGFITLLKRNSLFPHNAPHLQEAHGHA